jgi:hypothetical protein
MRRLPSCQLPPTHPLPPPPSRYSLFLPLYPVGVVCEMAAMVQALPHVQRTGMGSIRLPNAYNYGFDYAWFIKVCGASESAACLHVHCKQAGCMLGASILYCQVCNRWLRYNASREVNGCWAAALARFTIQPCPHPCVQAAV